MTEERKQIIAYLRKEAADYGYIDDTCYRENALLYAANAIEQRDAATCTQTQAPFAVLFDHSECGAHVEKRQEKAFKEICEALLELGLPKDRLTRVMMQVCQGRANPQWVPK